MEDMTARRPRTSWTRTGALLAGVAALLLLVACSDTGPLDTLKPEGPVAQKQYDLLIPVMWIAAFVFVLVEGLVLFISYRFRHREGVDAIPKQVHGNKRLEIGWTLIPTVLLAAISVPTVATIFELAKEPDPAERVDVRIIAHQWWWEVEYIDERLVTANEIHIPTGRPVYFTLEARNQNAEIPVIHSFWIPKLGGKQDVVPGRVNHLILQADHPGRYPGQCTEYCGLSHAYMRMAVVAESPEDYEAWLDEQEAAANVAPSDPLAQRGMELFRDFGDGRSCMQCHAINGLQGADVRIGPDLTHLASRETFGANLFDMNAEELTRWLENPAAMKPGSRMPDYGLTPDQIEALVAFLLSLE